jgi:hypothetical protein
VINELNDALKKISQRVNHGRHHWETHGEATRQG